MKNSINDLVDPTLAGAYDEEQMEVLARVASFCIHQSAVQRPQMNQACFLILQMLIRKLSLVLFMQ